MQLPVSFSFYRSSGSNADALLANITAVIANTVKGFILSIPDI
jgi:hypothetical protein